MATGNRTVNSLPHPRPPLSARMVPWCISTRFFTRVSPIPKPPPARVNELSTCIHLEHAAEHLGGNADSIVLHSNQHVAALGLDCEPDSPAAVRVFHRVAQQVGDDLGESRRVGFQPYRGIRQGDAQLMTGFIDQGAAGVHGVLDNGGHVHAASFSAPASRRRSAIRPADRRSDGPSAGLAAASYRAAAWSRRRRRAHVA